LTAAFSRQKRLPNLDRLLHTIRLERKVVTKEDIEQTDKLGEIGKKLYEKMKKAKKVKSG